MDGAELHALLATERARIEGVMAEVAGQAVAAADARLRDALGYALATRGKRIRPVLCLAAYRAVTRRSAPPGAYRLACALEVVHTYSLVHDDLPCMDDDDLRRGRPTLHRVYGVATATVVGAALLPLAMETVAAAAAELGLSAGATAALVAQLCEAAGAAGMVGGQLLDLEGESATVDAATLERIHRAKTGALLTAALRSGAMAAGAPPDVLDALSRYGAALGLAFQIADDILDVTGDAAALGKTAGRDVALEKASYPSLHGLEGARALALERVREAKAALGPLPSSELAALADLVVERRS